MPVDPHRTLHLSSEERAEVLAALRSLRETPISFEAVTPYRLSTDSFHVDLLYRRNDLHLQFHPLQTPTNRNPPAPWWEDLFPAQLSEVSLRLYYPRTFPQLRAEHVQLYPSNSGGDEAEVVDSWFMVIEDEKSPLVSTEEVLVEFLQSLDAQVRAALARSPRSGAAEGPRDTRTLGTRIGPSRRRFA